MGTRGDRTGPDLAQHFTPPDVARLVWRLAEELSDVRPGAWRVVDPSAGEGALLAAALELGAPGLGMCGIELDTELARRARARGLNVLCGDGLLDRFDGVPEGAFDVAIGNPPFGRCGRAMSETQMASMAGIDRYRIWRGAAGAGGPARPPVTRLRAVAIEHLFVERGLQLVRPGGLVVYVLPQGLFSNARTQRIRDWILERAEVLAVAALPAGVFRRPGLSATAAVLALRRRADGATATGRAALVVPRQGRAPRPALLERLLRDALVLHRAGRRVDGGVAVPAQALRGRRWDAGYWLDDPTPALERCPHPLHRLGDHVEHLTYGPIVTGQRPEQEEGGIRVIGQGDFTDAGLRPKPRLRVAAGSVFDPPRSRVRAGDLLLPRSGAGSLGRNRMAVYTSDEPANVGCFVDLVRLRDLNPFYTWAYLRTATGWAQIRRLINGVGVPNISFAEIRSLQVPWIEPALQMVVEDRYRQEVMPHVRAGEDDGGGGAAATFGRIAADLERYVSGESDSLPRSPSA